MVKRKFKQIEQNNEKSSQSPNRTNKRSKISPGTDSDRMIILTQKKVKTRLFEKTNLRNKEALNKLKYNDDSPEEKILSKNSGSQASDALFIDTKVSKKEKEEIKKIKIYNEKIFLRKRKMLSYLKSACSSDLSYHQSFQPHYWIFSSSKGYMEMVTAYYGHYVSQNLETIHFI